MRYMGLAVVICFFSLSTTVRADEILEQIHKDWQDRYKNHKTAQYKVHGKVLVPRGGVTPNAASDEYFPAGMSGPVPKEDYQHGVRKTILLDLQNGRARRETNSQIYFTSRESSITRFVPRWSWDLFDGKNYQLYTPRDKNQVGHAIDYDSPDLRLYGTKTLARFYTIPDFPVLFAHGIVPTHRFPSLPENMKRHRYLKEFTVLGREVINDREHVTLKTQRPKNNPNNESVHYWIDMARKSAIARVAWLQGTKEIARLDVNYQQVGDNWYPKDWVWRGICAKKGKSAPQKQFWVYALELDKPVSDEQFSVAIREGMIVRDIWKKKQYMHLDNGPNMPGTTMYWRQYRPGRSDSKLVLETEF